MVACRHTLPCSSWYAVMVEWWTMVSCGFWPSRRHEKMYWRTEVESVERWRWIDRGCMFTDSPFAVLKRCVIKLYPAVCLRACVHVRVWGRAHAIAHLPFVLG